MHEGETLEYYQFVRRRLAKGHFKYDPVEETRSMVRVLCEDLQYRCRRGGCRDRGPHAPATAAQPATRQYLRHQRRLGGVLDAVARRAPARRPSRNCATRLPGSWNWQRPGATDIAYSGSDLRRDLLDVYTREASACTISYARTDGTQQAAFVCRRHAAPASALVRSAPLRRTAVGRKRQGRALIVPRWRRQGRVVCGRAAPAQPDRAHLRCAHGFLAGRSQTQGARQRRGRSADVDVLKLSERDGLEHRAGRSRSE